VLPVLKAHWAVASRVIRMKERARSFMPFIRACVRVGYAGMTKPIASVATFR
jgi:hypothetical protein